MNTTIKTRSPLLSKPNEVQAAYNAFAVAVKNFTKQPTPENEKAMQDAQEKVYQVEDKYREGRKLRLEHAQAHSRCDV